MFYTGQRVQCVNDAFPQGGFDGLRANRPVKDRVYTVRDVLQWTWGDGERTWALRLFELSNPKANWVGEGYAEIPFSVHRFRPLVERKTSIECFTSLLKPVLENA